MTMTHAETNPSSLSRLSFPTPQSLSPELAPSEQYPPPLHDESMPQSGHCLVCTQPYQSTPACMACLCAIHIFRSGTDLEQSCTCIRCGIMGSLSVMSASLQGCLHLHQTEPLCLRQAQVHIHSPRPCRSQTAAYFKMTQKTSSCFDITIYCRNILVSIGCCECSACQRSLQVRRCHLRRLQR